MAKRSTGLGALAATGAALWLTQAAAEPPSASALDSAEANVCMATSRLQGSVAAAVQDSRQSIPIEQLAGRIDNPVSRVQLQRELDNRVTHAMREQQQRQVAMNAQTARMGQVLAAARLFPPG